MSDKIKPHHLDRKAILYVRQSSLHQVTHNREGRALQYAMRDRLRALGWSEIEVVDDDLGRSAAGTVTRAGFDRMVAEVYLGKDADGEACIITPHCASRPTDSSFPSGKRFPLRTSFRRALPGTCPTRRLRIQRRRRSGPRATSQTPSQPCVDD